MTMQFVGVMNLYKLHRLLLLVRQLLQGMTKRTLSALRQTNDGYFTVFCIRHSDF